MKSTFARLSTAVLLFALLTPAALWAQGLTGNIVGSVTDPANAVVPNASVTVRNVATNAEVKVSTDATGIYRALGLVSAEYRVSVEATGFRVTTTAPFTVDISTPVRVDVKLEVGQVTETVSVTAAASQINTEDAQLGRVLRNISDLPLLSGNNGRNPLSLVGIQPGVAVPTGRNGTGSTNFVGPFSVNGQRTQANNYLLDGGDANDLAINIPDSVQQISPDALAEFRVVTGAQKAEYGRNAGATIEVVTKSGGNGFHGNATEVFRNKVLNATPFFQKNTPGPIETFSNGFPRRPDYKANDFDADAGGRIRKDKTFFFVSYLGFRRVQGVTNSATVFTDAERALITQVGTPVAKTLLALVPRASTGSLLQSAPSNSLHRDQGLAKIDHRVSAKNSFSGNYFIEHQTAADPFPFGGSVIPGFGTIGTIRFQNLLLRDTHTFSPTLLNEARVSVHRRAQPGVLPVNTATPASLGLTGIIPDDASAAGPPSIRINGISEFGNTIQGPQARFDTTWQYSDTVSWTRGKHSWKFGGDYRAYEQNQVFDFINNGVFTFDGTGTQTGKVPATTGLAAPINDFARGFVSDFQQANGNRQGYRDKFFSVFAQNDWKFARNLTFNIGIRWEYDAPLTEINNQVATFRLGQQSKIFPDAPIGLVYPGDQGISNSSYKRDLNNFAPRFGFAWSPGKSGQWSIRGGYGIFFDAPVSELTLQFLGVPPYGTQPDMQNVTDYTRPYATSSSPIPQPFPYTPLKPGNRFNFANIAPIGLTVMNPDFATPYSQQYSLQVQRQFGNGWLADVAYVGTSGTKLLNRRPQNFAIVTPDASTANTNVRRRYNIGNPQSAAYGGAVFAGITDQLTDANSIYSAFQASLTKRLSKGLSMQHSYTWGHAIDEGSGLRTAGNGNIYNRSFDRGNAEFDVRHRYVGSFTYELPFAKDRGALLRTVAAGWGLSGIFTTQTGLPINIVEAADRCLCGMATSAQHPDFRGGTIQFYDPRSLTAVAGRGNAYFDGTGGGAGDGGLNPYFRRVGSGNTFATGAGRLGSFGRNVFHGPGFGNWDLSAYKKFRVTESSNLELRGEFLNAFNHTEFDAINSTNIGNIGSANFGIISQTRDPRFIQLTARFTF